MPEDLDDLDYGEDGEESPSAEGEAKGGLRSLFSGTLVKILIYVAGAIVVVMISVITAKCVAEGTSKSEGVRADQDDLVASMKKPPLQTFDVVEFMANTGDTDSPGLVRLKLQLGYQKDNIKLQNELNERRSEIRDLILLTLGEQKRSDLASSESKRKFKEVLSNRINRVLVAGKIEDIYYGEFSVN